MWSIDTWQSWDERIPTASSSCLKQIRKDGEPNRSFKKSEIARKQVISYAWFYFIVHLGWIMQGAQQQNLSTQLKQAIESGPQKVHIRFDL